MINHIEKKNQIAERLRMAGLRVTPQRGQCGLRFVRKRRVISPLTKSMSLPNTSYLSCHEPLFIIP